jgi:hypothetical protein
MELLNNMLTVSIKYEKVDTTILTGGVYPIIPEEDEDDF